MNEGQNPEAAQALAHKGARLYKQVIVAAVAITAGVWVQEILTWHALGFVIVQLLLLALMIGFGIWVGKRGKMRWGQFMVMLAAGAHNFLIGGLYLTDPRESAVDPRCYWLAGAGLVVVGLGCYILYSIEIDEFFKSQRDKHSA